MSHEISIMAMIAVTLLLIALVCGVVFFGISQSREIADQGQTTIADTIHMTDVILSVQQKGSMPAAAAYAILKEHPELIIRLDCHICGTAAIGLYVGDCLKSHMRGRVSLTLTEDESGGVYNAVITGG
jgi:anaerobic C4-dicarboxylate transporter